MKKNLLLLCTLFSIGAASAQINYTPTTSQGFVNGVVNQPYSQEITFAVPATVQLDASILGIPELSALPISLPPSDVVSTTLTVEGLPAGLSYSCSSAGCSFTPGSGRKITISGTPTAPGSFSVIIKSTVTGGITVPAIPGIFPGGTFPFPTPIPDVFNSGTYTLNIWGVSVEESELILNVVSNFPNPFSGFTTIQFESKKAQPVVLNITNSIGALVKSLNVNAVAGQNQIQFDASGLAAGIYTYSLQADGAKVSKQMMVK